MNKHMKNQYLQSSYQWPVLDFHWQAFRESLKLSILIHVWTENPDVVVGSYRVLSYVCVSYSLLKLRVKPPLVEKVWLPELIELSFIPSTTSWRHSSNVFWAPVKCQPHSCLWSWTSKSSRELVHASWGLVSLQPICFPKKERHIVCVVGRVLWTGFSGAFQLHAVKLFASPQISQYLMERSVTWFKIFTHWGGKPT